jgi:hypothetical protein
MHPMVPRAPSVPALAFDVDPGLEIEVECARFRKVRAPWAMIGAGILVAGVIAVLAVVRPGPASPTKAVVAAAHGHEETQLERERILRSARAAGQWVEIPEAARATPPCDSSQPPPSGAVPAPCPPAPEADTK